MSPEAGQLLVNEIAPAIRKKVYADWTRSFGGEDREELIADCIAMAAKRLHAMKRQRRQMPAKLLAHFIVKNARCGERFSGQGKADVMATRTQVQGRSILLSLDAPMRSADGEDETTFHDALVTRTDDPTIIAGRRLDWAELMKGVKDSHIDVICSMADGRGWRELASDYGLTQHWVQRTKYRLRRKLRSPFSDAIIRDAQMVPFWKKHIDAYQERARCRAERLYA